MFPESDDGNNIELGATLLTTTRGSVCNKKWLQWLYKKPTTSRANYEESTSPLSSVELRVTNDIAGIVKEKDLKSLLEFGGVGRVCDVLRGQIHHSSAEKITRNLGSSFFDFLWYTIKDNRCTVSLLLISALFSLAIGYMEEGLKYGWHDGVAIAFSVLLMLAFSSITSFWRHRKMMNKPTKRKGKEVKFNVKRGEVSQSVDLDLSASDIVVGDMMFLSPHDEVPADGLLVSHGILVLAKGIKKEKVDRDDNPFLIAGSEVIAGYGQMIVTSVRNESDFAEMNCSMSSHFEKRGLLEKLIEKPISYLDKASLFIFTLVAFVVFIHQICEKDGDGDGLPDMKVSVGLLMELLENILLRPRGRISILACVFTAAILFVQHGMPRMVTFSLHYHINDVVPDEEAVFNDLSACTTMGLVTVICVDVSGRLISKPMEVSEIWMGEGETEICEVEGSETVVLDKLKEGVVLSIISPELSLSPRSSALVSWAETKCEMDTNSFIERFDIFKHNKLNSDKGGSGVLVKEVLGTEQVLHLHWSGSASTILETCSRYYDGQGECHAMGNQKIKFVQKIIEMEGSGLKPIAFAYRKTYLQVLEQDDLTLLALIGFKEKSRESIKSALQGVQNTGIKIKLISEDDIDLVEEIAYELGIEVPVGGHLEGKEFKDLHEGARFDEVDKAIAMGSFCAEDKLCMVNYLQDKGDVVAFIDQRLITRHASEVLKVADVGIVSLNSLRKKMDKGSCGITMTCFSALEPIVKAGRRKYHNIQKFIQLQLTVSISGLLITLITTIFTGNSPLTAIQMIWINVLMCLLGGLMMVMELSREEELAKQPCDRNQPIITMKILKNIVYQVLYQAFLCMILQFGGHITHSEKQVRKTMIFNTFLFCQLFNLLNNVYLLKKQGLKMIVQNLIFSVALGSCVVMQVLVIQYAKGLADCVPLNTAGWTICVLVSALSWVFEWILKSLPVIMHTNYATSSEPAGTELLFAPIMLQHQNLRNLPV
ncbi:calcium-transporting ATPase 12, plasma membrane-type [Medicago truncatula]|uniref:calcium-transporting ATPase 12, plasma membrane-type n=1 Tax=Medicago truncatula TaxID=3880 RepID=UPI0019678E1C|nr:calcium-transporting ATPase 12, plasma membrane-type [Medicago truncatula]